MSPFDLNPTGDALQELRQRYGVAQLGGVAAPTIGNPGAQQAYQQQGLASLLESYKQAQADQQQAQGMLQAQPMPQGAGWVNVLAQVVNSLAGKKMAKKANESAMQYAERIFKAQGEQEAQRAAAQESADLRKWQREQQRIDLREKARAERKPDAVRTLEALMADPRLAAVDQARKRAGATSVSVNAARGPQFSAFQKALGGKQAEQLVTWQTDAVNASEAKERLAQLRTVMAAQKTGRVEEAKALVGQYFGTEAAANMQSFNATVAPLVIDLAAKLKPVSNVDMEFIQKAAPNFGFDPRANDRILSILDSAADRQIGLYEKAVQHAEDKGSLSGFRPDFAERRKGPAAPPAGPPVRARNPQTGEEVELRGDQWVKVK